MIRWYLLFPTFQDYKNALLTSGKNAKESGKVQKEFRLKLFTKTCGDYYRTHGGLHTEDRFHWHERHPGESYQVSRYYDETKVNKELPWSETVRTGGHSHCNRGSSTTANGTPQPEDNHPLIINSEVKTDLTSASSNNDIWSIYC